MFRGVHRLSSSPTSAAPLLLPLLMTNITLFRVTDRPIGLRVNGASLLIVGKVKRMLCTLRRLISGPVVLPLSSNKRGLGDENRLVRLVTCPNVTPVWSIMGRAAIRHLTGFPTHNSISIKLSSMVPLAFN